jgi:uncharacterized surface protein with fasciclin (FAS1) repeats
MIDGVLLPSWASNSISDRVVADSDLSTLFALAGIVGLSDALAFPGDFTLPAPISSAFAKLPEAIFDFLTSEGSERLTRILLYHIFYGVFNLFALDDGLVVCTFEVGTVTVSVDMPGLLPTAFSPTTVSSARLTLSWIPLLRSNLKVIPQFRITSSTPQS